MHLRRTTNCYLTLLIEDKEMHLRPAALRPRPSSQPPDMETQEPGRELATKQQFDPWRITCREA